MHVCVIGTLARGPLSVVAGTRTPVSSTLDRASGGSLLCGPHGRTHELNVLVNRATIDSRNSYRFPCDLLDLAK